MSTRTLEVDAVNVPRQQDAMPSPARRRRGIIITTAVVSLIAIAFYVGFIVMMVLRATHG
jgi:hypothetical protein